MRPFDNYEQAGITVPLGASGEIRTQCPECSHTRTKSKDKCLSVNLDKGTWHCHHCTWSGGLKRGGANPSGIEHNRATRTLMSVDKPDSGCSGVCNLDAYATAKCLPVDFLKMLRLGDFSYQNAPAILRCLH